MDSPCNHYYDLKNKVIYTINDNIAQNVKNETLLIPQIDEVSIINDYLTSLEYNTNSSRYKDLKLMCKNRSKGCEDAFYRYIDDNELYDDWVEYRWKYMYNCALKWCKAYGVYF